MNQITRTQIDAVIAAIFASLANIPHPSEDQMAAAMATENVVKQLTEAGWVVIS
jgi:hypothetical protein